MQEDRLHSQEILARSVATGDRRTQGIVLISLSAVAFSSAGFFTRLVPLDVWTVLFWRGVFAGLMIFWVIIVQERRRSWRAIRAVGLPGLAVAACSTAATSSTSTPSVAPRWRMSPSFLRWHRS